VSVERVAKTTSYNYARKALREAANVYGGAKLLAFAKQVVEGVNEGWNDYANDAQDVADVVRELENGSRLHEIAKSAVPVSHHKILELASEDFLLLITGPKVGLAFDGTLTPVGLAAENLYELASHIAHQQLRSLESEANKS